MLENLELELWSSCPQQRAALRIDKPREAPRVGVWGTLKGLVGHPKAVLVRLLSPDADLLSLHAQRQPTRSSVTSYSRSPEDREAELRPGSK